MPEGFQHGREYPQAFLGEDLREVLLRRSQTNVTHNPVLGEQFAAAAYDKAMRPEYRTSDPTAAGEAASKGELQAEIQADIDPTASQRADAWSLESFRLLSGNDERSRREVRATHLNHGRGRGLRLGRLMLKGQQSDELLQEARSAFSEALSGIDDDDPYGPMAHWLWANLEAMVGEPKAAAKLALGGMQRAIRSKQETANSPSGRLKHAAFVVKQAATNGSSAALAMTKFIPGFEQKRFSLAVRRFR